MNPNVVERLFRFNRSGTSVANHSLELYRNCLESVFDVDELQSYYVRGFHKNVFAPKIDIESVISDVKDISHTGETHASRVSDFSAERPDAKTRPLLKFEGGDQVPEWVLGRRGSKH